MNTNLLKHSGIITILLILLNVTNGFSVSRTWTGAGAGGAGTDFNTVGNWTGGGALASTDDYTMTITLAGPFTVSLSANITVNNLTVTLNNGDGSFTFDVAAKTLTINGSATFNTAGYSNPTHYDIMHVNVNTNGNIIFNGTARLHTSGSGITYFDTNNNTGSSTLPGTLTFNADVFVGASGRTTGAYEPHIIFNGAGAQTITLKCTGGGFMFKAQDLTFGTTNTPTVTIKGPGAQYFDTYDGNMTVAANTTVIIPDSTVIGYMCKFDRYSAGGTCTLGAGSLVKIGCPNDDAGGAPAFHVMGNFTTYALNATSTVWFFSVGWQAVLPITYGNLILDSNGGGGWKYYQGAFTVAGDLTMQGGAICAPYLAGGFTVNGNTLIQTSASMNATRDNVRPSTTYTLKGNFTNNSTFTNGSTPGINTMLFNSTTVGQTIGGTSLTTFYHLTIDNTSGSGVTLGRSENVSESAGTGVLTLTNGPLFLNTYTLAVQNPATTAVVRTNGYIVSEMNAALNTSFLQWNIGATNGTYVIPFGVSGTYIPFTFAKTAGNSNMKFSTRATAANDNLPLAGASSVAAVANMNSTVIGGSGAIPTTIDRWWDIHAISGPSTVTADLTFTYRGSENTTTIAPLGTFKAQHWNGTYWDTPVGAGTGVTAGTGTVTVSGANTFSPWVLTGSTAPLPIELVTFDAHLNISQVDLNWETATEVNNDFFTLEKSTDGENFQEFKKVAGAGNSSMTINYFDIDSDPYVGITYYRLKQTDFNGHSSYSGIVPVEYNLNGDPTISLFPNPSTAASSTYLALNELQGQEVVVVLRDITGKEVFSKVVISSTNKEVIAIDPEGKLAKGTYLVTATSANKLYSKKLIIK